MNRIQLATFLLAFAAVSCSEPEKTAGPASKSAPLRIQTYTVVAQPFSNQLVTTADILPVEQVSLQSPIAAQVLSISFTEGKKVSKGERIVRLDDRSWKAELHGINASLETAKKDLERTTALLKVEGSSQEDVDNAQTKVQQLEAQKQQLEVNIDLANVTAPFSGQLGMRNFSEGAFLKQGDLITTLTDYSKLKVSFNVPQEHAQSVSIDDTVWVRVANDTLPAQVYAQNPQVDSETRTLQFRAYLNQPKKAVVPGMFAEVVLPIQKVENALLVPTEAVVPSITEQSVYVVKNNTAQKRIVTLGNRTQNKVHILTGLEAGDTVITTGLLMIKDGMPVSIQQKTEGAQ